MMAADARDDGVFVYMGGNQRVPFHVRRVRIHISVKITLPRRAFQHCRQLISVEFHDGIEIIEEEAFLGCIILRSAKLLCVRIIKERAFKDCTGLLDVEFGDKLETIESQAFQYCAALKKIRMPSVRTIGIFAFSSCYELFDVECGEALETIQEGVFYYCPKLKQIALPMEANMIENHVFSYCPTLTRVNVVGGIHKAVASLNLKSWRSEMNNEINRINQVLPTDKAAFKTASIQQWMRTVNRRLDHYNGEHHKLMKEATTLLELALWKANLDDNNGGEGEGVRTTRSQRKRARKEICVMSGASIVIKNVLPFLQLSG